MGEAEARPFLEEGERYLQTGDYAAAERAFAQAVAAAPELAVAHSKLGVTLAHQGRHDAAIAQFSRAIALQPGYAPAYSNLGNAYREQGLANEALAAYQRALAIDPDYWVVHQNLGILYKEMGRVGDAVEHLKKATRLSARRPTKPGEPGQRRGCLGTALLGLAVVLVLAAALIV